MVKLYYVNTLIALTLSLPISKYHFLFTVQGKLEYRVLII